jgi:hypothetical protein
MRNVAAQPRPPLGDPTARSPETHRLVINRESRSEFKPVQQNPVSNPLTVGVHRTAIAQIGRSACSVG